MSIATNIRLALWAAVLAAMVPLSVASAQPLLFSDDFSTNTGWTSIDDNLPSTWRFGVAAPVTGDPALVQIGNQQNINLVTGNPGWTNYIFQVSFYPTDNDFVSFLVRRVDHDNYYRVSLGGDP